MSLYRPEHHEGDWLVRVARTFAFALCDLLRFLPISDECDACRKARVARLWEAYKARTP